MKDNYRVLSTRPLDEALVENAASQNIIIDIFPFIEIRKLVTEEIYRQIAKLANQNQTVVFTSVNAVEVVVEALPKAAVMPQWNIYCIGGATFTLVKKYWPYDLICFTAKNASDLARRIIADKVKNINFFCGNIKHEDLPYLLNQANIVVSETVVYETIKTPTKITETYDGILFFSPSAVNSFFSNNTISTETILFAIGNTTANTIKLFCDNCIIISEFPAKDQLVDKAIKYFKYSKK